MWMLVVEILDKPLTVLHIINSNPTVFFHGVSLPMDKVFQFSSRGSSGIQDFFNFIFQFFSKNLRRWWFWHGRTQSGSILIGT